MARITVLGSGNAVPEVGRENTHFFVQAGNQGVLIDCAANAFINLSRAGLPPAALTDVILTHFHPDHVAGVPLLLMDLWLIGRKTELHLYGLADVIERTQALMDLFEWRKWPGFYPLVYHPLPAEEMTPVIDRPELRVLASPVNHMIPTLGLRLEFHESGKSAAYSCDTEPCLQVERLARGVDLLFHEATGPSVGHSSAAQAGQVAERAGARQLALIHYGGQAAPEELLPQAAQYFHGPLLLARDLQVIDFD